MAAPFDEAETANALTLRVGFAERQNGKKLRWQFFGSFRPDFNIYYNYFFKFLQTNYIKIYFYNKKTAKKAVLNNLAYFYQLFCDKCVIFVKSRTTKQSGYVCSRAESFAKRQDFLSNNNALRRMVIHFVFVNKAII